MYWIKIKTGKEQISIKLTYQRDFEATDTLTRCVNDQDDNLSFFECANAVKMQQNEKRSLNLSAIYRSFILSDFLNRKIAFTVSTTYDFRDDESSLSLPVYFFGEKITADEKPDDLGLYGGIRFDYESGDRGTKLSLFIGSRFEIKG